MYQSVIDALNWATDLLSGKTVGASESESSSIVPSAGRLVDLTAFFATLELLGRSTQEDAPELTKEGMALAHKLQDEYVADVTQFVVPVLDGWGLRAFKTRWVKLAKHSKDGEVYAERAMFVLAVLNKLRGKQNIMHSIFTDGRVFASAKMLSELPELKTAEEQLKLLSVIRPVGHMANARSWMKKAFDVMNVDTPEFEDVIADVSLAEDLGQRLRNVDVAITNVDTEEGRARLEAERASIVNTIQETASQSVNPQAVLSTAATAASAKFNHKTETGRALMLSPEQEDAMMVRGKSIISAGAGSGKTRVMAGKVVYHIKELGAKPSQFIATSFSNKSARELVDRIKKYGGAELVEDGPSTEGMGTTHRVAGSIIRKYGNRVSQGEKPLSSSGQTALLRMAMEQVKLRPTQPVRAPLPRSFFDDPRSIQEGDVLELPKEELSPLREAAKQAAAIFEKSTPRLGWKTDMVVDIINKIAKGELKQPSQKQTPYANDGFAAAGLDFRISASVVSAAGKKSYDSGPRTGDSQYWRTPANKWFNLGVGEKGFVDADGKAIGTKQLGLKITNWKANLITPEQAFEEYGPKDIFAATYGAYEWLKNNAIEYNGWRDHDDTLLRACQIMVTNPTALAQLRARFKYILVDEAQDLNMCQHLMFGLISGTYDPDTQKPYEDGRISADTYTLIGDDKQAIYEFRGATPDKFIKMSELVGGGQNFKTVLLDTNYRSGKLIVDAANHLMSHNSKQIPMTCRAHEDRKGQGVITAKIVPTHEDGAAFVAATVRDLCDGEGAPMTYKDFGVAARTNAELFAFGAEFLKLGIPFRSKINFFNNSTTIALLNWMRLANASDGDKEVINEAVLSSYRAPNFNLNKIFDEQLQRKANGQNYLEYLKNGGWRNIYEGSQSWRNERYVRPYTEMLSAVKAKKGTPTEVLNFIMELRGPAIAAGKPSRSMLEDLVEEVKKDPEATDLLVEDANTKVTDEDVRQLALAPIQPLLSLCANYQDLGPCMSYIDKLSRANDKKHKDDNPEAADYEEPAVVLDTVHGWKGLETKHIFVPMAKNVFPHVKSMADEDALASERRLGYVAITRGQDNVTIICPEVNHVGRDAGPSPFVAEACIPIQGAEDKKEKVEASFTNEGIW
jgi:superfamily I DNA/RNA helicase